MRPLILILLTACADEAQGYDPCDAAESHARCVAGWEAAIDEGCPGIGSEDLDYALGYLHGCLALDEDEETG